MSSVPLSSLLLSSFLSVWMEKGCVHYFVFCCFINSDCHKSWQSVGTFRVWLSIDIVVLFVILHLYKLSKRRANVVLNQRVFIKCKQSAIDTRLPNTYTPNTHINRLYLCANQYREHERNITQTTNLFSPFDTNIRLHRTYVYLCIVIVWFGLVWFDSLWNTAVS